MRYSDFPIAVPESMKRLIPLLLVLLAACAAPAPEPVDPHASAPDFGSPGEAGYHLFMAEIALQRDRPALAATEYLRAARVSDDPEVAERATRIAAAHGTRSEGVEAAERWKTLAPGALHPRRFLARFYLEQGDRDRATAELAYLRRAAEGDTRPFLALLPLAGDAGDPEVSLAAMAAVAADYPEDASGAYTHAYLALRAGDALLAESESLRALRLDPEWTEAAVLHARAMAAGGRTDEALQWLAARPDGQEAQLTLERALMLMAAQRNDEARILLQQILNADPAAADALRALAYLEYFAGRAEAAREALMALLASGEHTSDAVFYLGSLAEQAGEIEEAARFYSQVAGGEHLLTAQVRLALLMFRMGRPELAIQHLELFAQRNPSAEIPLGAARAELLLRLGLPQDALEVYDELLARHPDEDGLLYARGLLHVELGNDEAALEDFTGLVAAMPDDATALNALGFSLTDMTDRHDEAYALIRRALELEPESPAILDSMGWVLYRLGRPQEALPYLEQAWARQRDPEIAAHLGEVRWSLGQVDAAREIWLEAIVEFPGSEILLDTMGRLDP